MYFIERSYSIKKKLHIKTTLNKLEKHYLLEQVQSL